MPVASLENSASDGPWQSALPLVMGTNNKGYEVSQGELNISIESFLQNHYKAENPSEIEYLSSFRPF